MSKRNGTSATHRRRLQPVVVLLQLLHLSLDVRQTSGFVELPRNKVEFDLHGSGGRGGGVGGALHSRDNGGGGGGGVGGVGGVGFGSGAALLVVASPSLSSSLSVQTRHALVVGLAASANHAKEARLRATRRVQRGGVANVHLVSKVIRRQRHLACETHAVDADAANAHYFVVNAVIVIVERVVVARPVFFVANGSSVVVAVVKTARRR
jgi:hypothetical protein